MDVLNRPWPVRPKPLPDEVFSSWLYRAAKANGQKLHTLCDLTVRKVPILNRDIDKSITLPTLKAFATKLNTPIEQAFSTTLASFEGRIYEKHNPKGHTKHILPLGIYHRNRKGFGQQYCSACLATDNIPYYRKFWRLSFATVCPVHHLKLMDRCINCGSPVVFFRNELKEKHKPYVGSFTICHQCGFDLKNATSLAASAQAISMTAEFIRVLTEGYYVIPNHHWVYSHSYFDVVRQLSKIARDRHYLQPKKNEPEYLSLYSRYQRFEHISELMKCWPHGLVHYCKTHGITHSTLTQDFGKSPLWFQKPVDQYLNQSIYTPNEREIKHAIRHLLDNNESVNSKKINQLMGYRDSKTIAKIARQHRNSRKR